METVTSKDGTTIAFDRAGTGPSVILIGGGPTDRHANDPLAALLAEQFTVVNHDRRGRGDSGEATPYAVEREIEDLEALIAAEGGAAAVYGTSSGAAFGALAASRGLGITRLALWEPPFVVDDSRPPIPADYKARLAAMVGAGRREDALEYFFTAIVGMPAEVVAPMRLSPFFPVMAESAHVLVYEAEVMGDYTLPAQRLAAVEVPTVVLDGGVTPWLCAAAQAVADHLPDGKRRTLTGQPHNVAAEAIAPALAEFFGEQL